MKKAIVVKKNGGIVECEYEQDRIIHILYSLDKCRTVNFNNKTFACDEIEQVEWID